MSANLRCIEHGDRGLVLISALKEWEAWLLTVDIKKGNTSPKRVPLFYFRMSQITNGIRARLCSG